MMAEGGEGLSPADIRGRNVPAEGIISAEAPRWGFQEQQGGQGSWSGRSRRE